MLRKSIQLLLALLLAAGPAVAAEEFVLRQKYPEVKPLSTQQLAEAYDQTIIVDVRSKLEYDVVHINKALHLPVAVGSFVHDLEKVRAKAGSEPIAFYCNGYTCAKSYKAAVTAQQAGFVNVYAYDAGINEWLNSYPDRATLMAQSPAAPQRLIPEEALKQRKIPYAEFARRAQESQALVIDIREPFQRAKDPELPQNRMLQLEGVRNIPSDRLVTLLAAHEFRDRQLLITDAVGKQVRWLQYYLQEYGYENYAFLDRGVLGAAEAGGVR